MDDQMWINVEQPVSYYTTYYNYTDHYYIIM